MPVLSEQKEPKSIDALFVFGVRDVAEVKIASQLGTMLFCLMTFRGTDCDYDQSNCTLDIAKRSIIYGDIFHRY